MVDKFSLCILVLPCLEFVSCITWSYLVAESEKNQVAQIKDIKKEIYIY